MTVFENKSPLELIDQYVIYQVIDALHMWSIAFMSNHNFKWYLGYTLCHMLSIITVTMQGECEVSSFWDIGC